MANLLIIDDEPAIREAVRECLEFAGHTVFEAPDGRSGLVELQRYCIDLALVDIVMPHKEGVETIKEMRAACPEIKIIAMSGRPKKELYLSIAKKFGADDILSKPFDAADLNGKIVSLIGASFEGEDRLDHSDRSQRTDARRSWPAATD